MAHPSNKHERHWEGEKRGKKRVKGLLDHHYFNEDIIKKQERLHRNSTKLCSCHMCANKRGTEKGINKLTIQERKHFQDED